MVSDHEQRILRRSFTGTEQRIRDYIHANPGCTQAEIQNFIYGQLAVKTRVVQVHLSRIKRKLESTSASRLIAYRHLMGPWQCYEIIKLRTQTLADRTFTNAPTILPPILP